MQFTLNKKLTLICLSLAALTGQSFAQTQSDIDSTIGSIHHHLKSAGLTVLDANEQTRILNLSSASDLAKLMNGAILISNQDPRYGFKVAMKSKEDRVLVNLEALKQTQSGYLPFTSPISRSISLVDSSSQTELESRLDRTIQSMHSSIKLQLASSDSHKKFLKLALSLFVPSAHAQTTESNTAAYIKAGVQILIGAGLATFGYIGVKQVRKATGVGFPGKTLAYIGAIPVAGFGIALVSGGIFKLVRLIRGVPAIPEADFEQN